MVFDLSNIRFLNVISWLYFVLIGNGVFILLGIDLWGIGLAKPSFLFQEPSHYAIVLAPFLIFVCSYCRERNKLVAISSLTFFFAISIYVENMTLLVSVILAFTVYSRTKLYLLFVVIVGLVFFIYFYSGSEIAYFSSRLNISSQSDNLSSLVFLQGWQNAFLTLSDMPNYYLGAGFQQFGVNTAAGDATDAIFMLTGSELNRYDGGSVAPKVIGEFGLFGIGILIAYTIYGVKMFYSIRHGAFRNNPKLLFSASVIVGCFIEMYIRGTGFFSPTITMFWCSIFYMHTYNKLVNT